MARRADAGTRDEPIGAISTVVKSTATAETTSGTVPPTTASLPASTIPAPAPDVSLPDEYPIVFPPGGDVTDVTEEIENNSGTDQLVTRVGVWYDGDRLEEFAVFYLKWIVDTGYLIGGSLINEDERRVMIRVSSSRERHVRIDGGCGRGFHGGIDPVGSTTGLKGS